MKPARLKLVILSVVTSICLAVVPVSRSFAGTEALAQAPVESQGVVKHREPRLRGVGLIVSGSLLGVVAIHAAMIGGLDWLSAKAVVPEEDEVVDAEARGRLIFLLGAGGTLVAGVLLGSGIVLNQRYQSWKSRPAHEKLARRWVLPSFGWNGRTHRVGVQGRF